VDGRDMNLTNSCRPQASTTSLEVQDAAEEVNGFRATRHELEQVLRYWDTRLTEQVLNQMTGRPSNVELGDYACRRILHVTECLGIGFDQAPDGEGGWQRAWWRPPVSYVLSLASQGACEPPASAQSSDNAVR
jgi:hypothetical protein